MSLILLFKGQPIRISSHAERWHHSKSMRRRASTPKASTLGQEISSTRNLPRSSIDRPSRAMQCKAIRNSAMESRRWSFAAPLSTRTTLRANLRPVVSLRYLLMARLRQKSDAEWSKILVAAVSESSPRATLFRRGSTYRASKLALASALHNRKVCGYSKWVASSGPLRAKSERSFSTILATQYVMACLPRFASGRYREAQHARALKNLGLAFALSVSLHLRRQIRLALNVAECSQRERW